MFDDRGKQEEWEKFSHLDLNPMMEDTIRDLIEAIWTFQWFGREDAEFNLIVYEGEPALRLIVWTTDSERDAEGDLDVETQPLAITRPIDPYIEAKEQMRSLIHFHLCHEVDERLAFNNELVFYPKHTQHPTLEGVSTCV